MRKFLTASILLLVCGFVNAWADFDMGTGVLTSFSEYSFRKWMKSEGRSYRTKSEYKLRYHNYLENEKIVDNLNSQHDGTGYGLGLFADKSEAEMKTLFFTYKSSNDTP